MKTLLFQDFFSARFFLSFPKIHHQDLFLLVSITFFFTFFEGISLHSNTFPFCTIGKFKTFPFYTIVKFKKFWFYFHKCKTSGVFYFEVFISVHVSVTSRTDLITKNNMEISASFRRIN